MHSIAIGASHQAYREAQTHATFVQRGPLPLQRAEREAVGHRSVSQAEQEAGQSVSPTASIAGRTTHLSESATDDEYKT